jgi:ubiquinol-cytochrome c reductase cytochrome b subunit
VGGSPVKPVTVAVGQIAATYYFLHFLVILPLVSRFETPLPLPSSITASVLAHVEGEAEPAGVKPKRGKAATAAAE